MNKQFQACLQGTLSAVIICCLLISCNKGTFNEYSAEGKGYTQVPAGPDILYLQTNNYENGQNAILAYRVQNDNVPVLIEGAPFSTKGAGLPNTQNPACFESDHEVVISTDKRFLLTVNAGDNSVSVFSIQSDGKLQLVPGAPFSSGGETPVSIAQWQQYIIVLNKSNNPVKPSTAAPNYSVFTLENNGSLTPISKFNIREGIAPAQVLVSGSGPFVYGSNSWGGDYSPPANQLNLFSIEKNGYLVAGPDAPSTPSVGPGALGLCESLQQHVLYVAYPYSNQFGYYDMNTTNGALTHVGNASAGAGCSRFATNNSNDRLFTTNTIENSVSMFDITNARMPRKTGELVLKQSGPTYTGYFGTYTTSQCVSLATSTNGQFVYIVSQHSNANITGNYNYLHILQITDAGLQEQEEPIQLPVENKFRPRGMAVLSGNKL